MTIPAGFGRYVFDLALIFMAVLIASQASMMIRSKLWPGAAMCIPDTVPHTPHRKETDA